MADRIRIGHDMSSRRFIGTFGVAAIALPAAGLLEACGTPPPDISLEVHSNLAQIPGVDIDNKAKLFGKEVPVAGFGGGPKFYRGMELVVGPTVQLEPTVISPKLRIND